VTVDALEYLRAEDPVPHGSTAPPMAWVLDRIERTGAQPEPRPRVRFAFVPAVAVAATVAVVAAVIVIVATHHRHEPAHVPPATRTAPAVRSVPSPESLMPRGGMRGLVQIQGAASASAKHVLVYFGSGTGSTTREWRAETADGGASWHVTRDSTNLTMFAFAGRDGWAEGLDSTRAARFFASHDGGRTWHVATSDAPAPGGVGGVSVADGEVWSLGEGCCSDTVLRARASGDHLAATVAQPPLGNSTNVSVIAAGRDSAYVLSSGTSAVPEARLFGTHDAGRSWHPFTAPCSLRSFGRLYPGGGAALWASCVGNRGPGVIRRSTDGGVSWATPAAAGLGTISQIQPESTDVAWAVAAGGRVMRTSDGGRSWSQVWYGGKPEPAVLAGSVPPGLNRAWGVVLTVQSPATATVIVSVTRGGGHAARTNFVTYRTTDGGRTWSPTVVRLPAG
jgi:photosystem II stability/assembly factor-like uncharacterized protein